MNRISFALLGFLTACNETWGSPAIEAAPLDKPILVGMRQGIDIKTGARRKMMLRSDGAPVTPTNVEVRVWPPGVVEATVEGETVWLDAKQAGAATVVVTGEALGTSSELAFTAHTVAPSSVKHRIFLPEHRELHAGERIELATGFEYEVTSTLLYADGSETAGYAELTTTLAADGYRQQQERWKYSGFISSKTARTISLPTRGAGTPVAVTFVDPAKVSITWGPDRGDGYREGRFQAVRADGTPLELPSAVRGSYEILTPAVCAATHKWSHPEDVPRTAENGLTSDVFNHGKVLVGHKKAAPAGEPCRVRIEVSRGDLPPLAIETIVP